MCVISNIDYLSYSIADLLNDGSAGPTEDTVATAESTVDGGRFTGGIEDLPPQLLMDELKREAAQGG